MRSSVIALESVSSAEKPMTDAPVRLTFLDGLRGLAALGIVLHHASYTNWAEGTLPHSVNLMAKALTYGRFAVAIFIVLSGYCLMLPVARSRDGHLRGGALTYLRRRARRILPPYYIALVGTLVLLLLFPVMRQSSGTYWDGALPALTPGALLSHLFLVHNLSPAWNFKIDPPMWSVASEWQIYFVFPCFLLPLWRRYGITVSTVAGVLLGLSLHFLLGSRIDKSASPWFIGLFAMGMTGAAINFSPNPTLARLRLQMPWAWVNGGLWLLVAAGCVGWSRWWWSHLWYSETLLGLAVTCLIVTCAQAVQSDACGQVAGRENGGQSGGSLLLRLFEARVSVLLGVFSYSLYLIHTPLLALVHFSTRAFTPTPLLRYAVMLGVAMPISIVVSYGFHLAFERRYMSHSPRTEKETIASAIASPAP